jgi:hypothetical protein
MAHAVTTGSALPRVPSRGHRVEPRRKRGSQRVPTFAASVPVVNGAAHLVSSETYEDTPGSDGSQPRRSYS